MQKKTPIICLLLIWHVLGPLKTFISACVRARLCVCQNEAECMRERERAIHVLMIHSICDAFILFLFFPLLYVQYKYSGFITKLTSSAVTGIEVSSG